MCMSSIFNKIITQLSQQCRKHEVKVQGLEGFFSYLCNTRECKIRIPPEHKLIVRSLERESKKAVNNNARSPRIHDL